ncbi:MAG: LuxR C-terminal-related transcriptional regulator [Gemmatimonadetes bacterium]|nr:LuxR C-terminal-related transcriptional regulator [Gemmatimonadota bacterium]
MQRRVKEGLALLDEAMVAVATDELSPQVTGLIYCSAIGACRSVWELRRAHEWTAALSDWCERQPDLVPYRGECLVYRAEILQLRGAWGDALEEVQRARERIARGSDREADAAALYRKGEVHRLRGELAHAEEAYRDASRLGREPQPGLALLRLAQGDAEAAAAALRRALAEAGHGLGRARLLPALVEVALELGEVEEAKRACAELEAVATDAGTDVLDTLVAQARGAVELAAGDAQAALPLLRTAFEGWEAMEAPYEAARVRVLRGLACRALGDHDSAALELDGARATFDRLGAAPDAARVDALSGSRRPRAAHGLTPRELEVLAQVATGRTNRAIAGELFISEKTVARHVSNIFSKLGLSSRAAATAYAYEHDLVDPLA